MEMLRIAYDGEDITQSPEELIEAMFGATDENGRLLIPEFSYDSDGEADGLYLCVMDWKEEDKTALISRIRDLCAAFRRIGEAGMGSVPAGEDEAVWLRYVCPLTADGVEEQALIALSEKLMQGEALTPAEEAVIEAYRAGVYADAERRLGKGECAYDVCVRAQRVCALIETGAPGEIVNAEMRLFAAALCLHGYCREKTVIPRA